MLKNVLVVIVGFVCGSVVNGLLVNLGPVIVPLPEGADVSSMEGLKKSMALFKPANFLFPFLGHAVGTLVGALLVARLAKTHAVRLAWLVGVLFFLGGATMVATVGGPVWFCALDLVFAYFPMAYLGGYLGNRMSGNA